MSVSFSFFFFFCFFVETNFVDVKEFCDLMTCVHDNLEMD